MDDSQVLEALRAGMDPDLAVRGAAEAYLESVKHAPGFVAALIRIATSDADLGTRQMAAIILKNVAYEWETDGLYLEAEKQLVRSNLIPLLMFT